MFKERFFGERPEGKIDGNLNSIEENNTQPNYMTPELEEVLNKVGFDDDYKWEMEQDNREVSLDENGCPVLPDGWTFLTHGSSLDRWDTSQLGSDFVVGDGIANGKAVSRRPLCCVERHVAQYDYDRSGANTAQSYGGENQAFQIRVLYYSNPRTSDGKSVREKLSPEQISEITKCYMYQDGRHPAIPAGTKLSFLANGDFDEITKTNGNNILWYIPEQYLEAYLEDTKQMNISKDEIVFEDKTVVIEEGTSQPTKTLTNADVEKELIEFYSDDISISTIEAYLVPKIQAIYGDKLQNAGITDIRKFLDGKLENFEGVLSYRDIVEELEEVIEAAEKYKNVSYEADIEDKSEELSPLLKGITGSDTVATYEEAKKEAERRRAKQESVPRVKDKGINIGGRG